MKCRVSQEDDGTYSLHIKLEEIELNGVINELNHNPNNMGYYVQTLLETIDGSKAHKTIKGYNMPLHQFYYDASKRIDEHCEGYGEACFNHLTFVKPVMAEEIRGSEKDPTTSIGFDARWDKFVDYIERH